MALSIDQTVSADTSVASLTVTTASFSTTSAPQLLIAFIGSDQVSVAQSASGAGLTWTTVQNEATNPGGATISYAWATSILTNVTVKGTSDASGNMTISVLTFKGANATSGTGSSAIGASNHSAPATGAPSLNLTTTKNNSWVMGVITDGTTSLTPTLGSNQTLIHLDTTPSTWMQRQTLTTPTSGTLVTINDTFPTADPTNIAIIEILPSALDSSTDPAMYLKRPTYAPNNVKPIITDY